jgi:hypothetical protein
LNYHVSIQYEQDYDQVARWLEQAARDNPKIAMVATPGGFNLAITSDDKIGRWQQEQFDAGRGSLAGFCFVEVHHAQSLFYFDLACGDADLQTAAALLRELFKRFPAFSAWDGDYNRDCTAEMRERYG